MIEPQLNVDVQRCFPNDFTRHVPDRTSRLIDRDMPDPILFARFVNEPFDPWYHFLDWHACVQEPETDLAPELLPYANDELVFTKPGLAGHAVLARNIGAMNLRDPGLSGGLLAAPLPKTESQLVAKCCRCRRPRGPTPTR